MTNLYLNKNTVVYGNDKSEVSAYVQKIQKSLEEKNIIFNLSSENYAQVNDIIEKRISLQREKDRIKYYDSILHTLDSEEYQRIKTLREQSFEFIRDHNIYELHKFTTIVVIIDKCEKYNDLILRILMNSIDISVFVVVACTLIKSIKPHIRTIFHNIVLLDRDMISQYVFNITNLCHKKVRQDAQELLDNGSNNTIIFNRY